MKSTGFAAHNGSVVLAMMIAACGTSSTTGQKDSGREPDGASSVDAGSGPAHCTACLDDTSCGGAACVQFPGDAYCAKPCGSDADCHADEACIVMTSTSGAHPTVCVPRSETCGGTRSDAGVADAGGGSDASVTDAGGTDCSVLIGPNEPAGCNACGTRPCQTNGCYNGYLCDTRGNRCVAPTTPCPGGVTDAGSVPPIVDASPPTGTVGGDGGTLSRLYFGILGDTRPATNDDTANYPTDIITKIYAGVSAFQPSPPFVVATGDYMFASTGTSGKHQADPQLSLYMAARQQYGGLFFPTMGNHECTGWTNSNCGTGNADGITDNYTVFADRMLAPIGKTQPYYSIGINATDGRWTSKFVFVAANAWDAAQSAWLDSVLSQPTTYTFVIRHEAKSANTAPGVNPSETIMAKYPYTLALVGHDHTYSRTGQREVVVGNGGAPITGAASYGYALVNQRADDAIQVDMYDYQTGRADSRFSFAVKADGSTAP